MTADPVPALVKAAVKATLDKLRADDPATGWKARRARAVWDLARREHVPQTRIAALLRAGLLAAGVSEADIDGAGVSHDNVRRIVDGPRP